MDAMLPVGLSDRIGDELTGQVLDARPEGLLIVPKGEKVPNFQGFYT
jgi:hypothetical protein